MVVDFLSTTSGSKSTLPCSELSLFHVHGTQWLLWLVHEEVFIPPFHVGLQVNGAPATCVYTYAAGLGGRLRTIASCPAYLDLFPPSLLCNRDLDAQI
jgi:hypothetical protein